ncbi:MerR family transcriptional regulator [Cellvibrio zantedeschiae]|uniref:MerR family transcriptional regulator n=1 Tax=Cellvibrio zantedeschiae TaxID=1237077 RepID=A0ABQ3AQS7_9GAMM|nr:helix-turn-helix domain-containing protein [Cellvibrio zantedeschiae]GGY63690.1 MerR family transcriptional regulator [Cellvibrio zantedeschiae]
MLGIGELSRSTGCPIETIRYYEKLQLLHAPLRTDGGHRLYNRNHQKRLEFILKARGLGFTLEKTRELLSLSENNERSCSEALALVQNNLTAVNEKLAELERIKASLLEMAKSCKSCCPGAKAPDCTIVDALSTTEPQ